MNKLLIAAAVAATLGAALPAAAQTRDYRPTSSQFRPVEQRFDRDDHYNVRISWSARERARRLAEERWIENHRFGGVYNHRDSGYGERR